MGANCCGSRDPNTVKGGKTAGGPLASMDGVNFKSMDPVRNTILKLLKEGTYFILIQRTCNFPFLPVISLTLSH